MNQVINSVDAQTYALPVFMHYRNGIIEISTVSRITYGCAGKRLRFTSFGNLLAIDGRWIPALSQNFTELVLIYAA